MTKDKISGIDVGGMKSAILREDGSLIILARKTGFDFTEKDWDVIVEISPIGVKNLKDLLARDAQTLFTLRG